MQDELFRRPILGRAEIKAVARERFRDWRWKMVGAYVLYLVISLLIGLLPLGIVAVLTLPVLTVLFSAFWIRTWRGEQPEVQSVFSDVFTNYGRKLGGMLFAELKIFLWSLLFVIPGIIEALACSMTQYILAEYPMVRATDASRLSSLITKGYKGDILIMMLSFLGWMLLGGLTFGILQVLYVGPYMETAMAGLYDELVQDALQSGRISQEMLDGTRSPGAVLM